jgi:biotin synthase
MIYMLKITKRIWYKFALFSQLKLVVVQKIADIVRKVFIVMIPIEATPLMSLEEVEKQAKLARDQGSTRFCMGAAWRRPSNKNIDRVIKMIDIVHDLGMESCVTLGMLSEDQAVRLSKSGLNYYNHNLDTSREHYTKVISTRNYQDRLNTLKYVRESGIKVCSGGILGLGESRDDRAKAFNRIS